jgi:hypothetical protein
MVSQVIVLMSISLFGQAMILISSATAAKDLLDRWSEI